MKAPGTPEAAAFEEHLHNDMMRFAGAIAFGLTVLDIYYNIVLVFS